MKFGVVNKSTTVNRFVLHTLQPNIKQLAVITHKTNIKLGILKGEKLKKSRKLNCNSFLWLSIIMRVVTKHCEQAN